MQPKNYLNNKDILKEIHKCKSSYCSFLDPSYADYDIILNSTTEIHEKLEEAKQQRATRLNKIIHTNTTLPKNEIPVIHPHEIEITDLVFRVKTWDHIPTIQVTPKKVTKSKKKNPIEDEDSLFMEFDDLEKESETKSKYQKVNFPPFQHFKLKLENDEYIPYCVGKSHWVGDLTTGKFSTTHGKLTNEIAKMYLKICERFATRTNWRGYSYNDEMKSQAILQLTAVGLQFDESKTENPFGFWSIIIDNSFSKVWNVEKRNQNIRDDILEMNNYNPSMTRQNDWNYSSD